MDNTTQGFISPSPASALTAGAILRTCKQCFASLPESSFGHRKNGRARKWCNACYAEYTRKNKEVHGRTYENRNSILKALGYRTYSEYLASPLWKRIRAKVYAKKGNLCSVCERPANALHHNRYHRNDLTGKCIRFIVPICNDCHKRIEFSDGVKATVKQAAKAHRLNTEAFKKFVQNLSLD